MANKYLAHIAEDGREQSVEEHLENTAKRCMDFAKSFGAKEQGRLIGLAHDIGKCSKAFQERLNGGKIVDHASAGALECAKRDSLWAACCVAGHHGGLPDVGNAMNDTPDDPTLFGRMRKAINGGIPEYEMPFDLFSAPDPDGYGSSYLRDSFVIRMLYSCLVDADYLDTESFMSNGTAERSSGESLPILLKKLNRYIEPWWKPKNELNHMRCEILRECIEHGKQGRGLYTLTVPTGGGKTISSMAFALNHAVEHGMDRVIYVIPYTSIIEQTAAVFREVFGAGNVVEHHSNASWEVQEQGDTAQYRNIQATENWDAPIIVTTAVQFFESLYANRPSKCRKLHNIANSVVIFDEAQMLPTEHLRPCIAAIADLIRDFRVTAVLCTATQPSLNDLFAQYNPGIRPIEICADTECLFSAFRRVSFVEIGTVDAEGLAQRLGQLAQVLCIVNSRKSAQAVYEKLPAKGSYHLSTLMYPAHRRAVLAEIRSRLREGLSCRVVSTSLIEAGVDVDFPAVFRELAGLDSILQAAGRCNREGTRRSEESVVSVFQGVSAVPQLMRINIGAAKEALKNGTDLGSPETVTRYFQAYRSLAGGRLDKNGVISALSDGILGRILPFRTVAESFRLIDDTTRTVIIPFGKGKELVRRLLGGERSRLLSRELGQYSVNIYDAHFQALLGRGALELLDDNNAILTDLSLYDIKTGLALRDNTETGLFI